MKNRGGFTIIETLITMTVAVALFAIIMAVFNGRQGRVEFSQGLRDIDSHLRTIADEVRNGYFPKLNGVICGTNASGAVEFTAIAGPTEQGTNQGCIFAGKAVSIDASSQNITRYTLAGNKKATNLATLNPVLINGTLPSGVTYDSSDTYRIPAGIKLVTKTGANAGVLLGIFYDLGSLSDLSSGSASLLLKKINNDSNNLDVIKDNVKKSFTSVAPGPTALDIPADGLLLCFKSGTSNQYGTIRLNKSISGFSSTVLIGQDITNEACANG